MKFSLKLIMKCTTGTGETEPGEKKSAFEKGDKTKNSRIKNSRSENSGSKNGRSENSRTKNSRSENSRIKNSRTKNSIPGKSRIRRAEALVLAAMMAVSTLAGCGAAAEEIPELIAPAAEVGYYLPAETGNVGDAKIFNGRVCAASYGEFFRTAAVVTQICVSIGDTVKEGDILAKADIADAESYLASLQASLEYENESWNLNDAIYGEQIRMAQLQGSDSSSVSVTKENREYDRQLHEYRVEKLQEQIDDYQEITENGTLTADHDGKVTYIKDLSEMTTAAAYENIVVIEDDTTSWIQLTDQTIGEFPYENYEEKFIYCAGQQVEVTELPYASEESILCQANGSYPYVRFSCPEGSGLEIGDDCPVYFIYKACNNVTRIGRSAIIRSDGQTVVYVRGENGEKELRQVEVGRRDSYYAEITSGLEPGEYVYYETSVMAPEEYEEYTVELKDYQYLNYCDWWQKSWTDTRVYSASFDGTVTNIQADDGDEVTEGQLLYQLSTDNRAASLEDAQTAIEKENQSYDTNYDKLYDQKKSMSGMGTSGAAGCALRIVEDQLELLTLTHENTLRQLQEKFDSIDEDNDGDGLISVYAETDGTIQAVNVKDGEDVSKGTAILVASAGTVDKLLFVMKDSDKVTIDKDCPPKTGESIDLTGTVVLTEAEKEGMTDEEIEEKETEEISIKAVCTGVSVTKEAAAVPYVSSDGEEASLSYCRETTLSQQSFYVELEDPGLYDELPNRLTATFAAYEAKDAISIPADAVVTEKDTTGMATGNYYVWVKKDGRMVQQYVQIDNDHSTYSEILVLYGLSEGDVIAVMD